MNAFLEEIIAGLSQEQKQLQPKYFYDAQGDLIFQKIMGCDEYYLTRCEKEIFETHTAEIANTLKNSNDDFDLIELGAGDASKTIHVLEELMNSSTSFTYVPIDISANIIRHLEKSLPRQINGLQVKGLHGEYLHMLQSANRGADRKKIILFLGSNIGNMEPGEARQFLQLMKATMSPGDQVLIGFDLKKNPATILAAYNDAAGYTKAFNLNLLARINSELGGDFELDAFEHYQTYDPGSGACKSYLVSTKKQQVHIGQQLICFEEDEVIFMEISQKYSVAEINRLAEDAGFIPVKSFFDTKQWFMDVVWKLAN